ncbi:ABC transporter substrate-binding protein, partial [Rhodoplanes serenus]
MLISGIGSNAINYGLYPKLAYADRDFQHVSLLITGPNVIAVNPALPAKTLPELIALAKDADGKFQAANSGNGSSNHLG